MDPAIDDEAEFDDFVAVVGMAGRFPESPDLNAFWDNLRHGRDCLHTFSDAELDELGIPAHLYQQNNFVRRGTQLDARDDFDARFFGYTPKQAAIMDPQARIFLETSYQALESAGYNPFETGHTVGVFAGSNPNDYALLLGVADPTDSLGAFDQMIGVDRDFIATRVSHNLDLTGPAMTMQTACSTSLVTIHAAVQSLLAYECSMALAGGVSVNLRQGVGYFYQQGMILSPTGECRAFDANAEGTTLGQGCGVVALKRLADAEDDNDNILAVVRATAINNDGKAKISYTAPSEDGQAAVIATALGLAGVESDSIGYVETHGTGTLLGDPIEVAALTRAFRPGTTRRQYCAIGSAKTNFGHTDAAAGVTGFIKTVLTLHHGEIPPSIHYNEPNPQIDFANSPFYVNSRLQPWSEGQAPRRAGVSAFGIGGTNAHAILEQAPTATPTPAPSRPQLLVVSGRTATAAERRLGDLADALDRSDTPDSPDTCDAPALADVAYTLRSGRPHLAERRAVVVRPGEPLAATIRGEGDSRVVRGQAQGPVPSLVWLFAGQGAQYPSMGRGLYEREPVFAHSVDETTSLLDDLLGIDLCAAIFAPADEQAAQVLRQTSVTQPALFVIEHAMAALLRSWGLAPTAVLGHSIGEYAAAVEAGIMSWQDGARLVAERGRLMQAMEPGSMLAVSLPAEQLSARLPEGIELAAENSSGLSVASGPTPSIEQFAARLEADGIANQTLHTSHAFHSEMMAPAVEEFAAALARVQLSPPRIPLISNITGRPLSDAEATDPNFWASQIRRPVRFAQCLANVAAGGPMAFVELGPGQALSTFVNAHEGVEAVTAGPTMRHPRQDRDDQLVALEAMGRLWANGVELDWDALGGGGEARRVLLPTYPFERERAWLPSHRHVLALPHFGPPTAQAQGPTTREPLDRWLYVPSWRRVPASEAVPEQGTTVLLAPAGAAGTELGRQLRAASAGRVIIVRPTPGGSGALAMADGVLGDDVVVDAEDEQGLARFFATLVEAEVDVGRVVHAWLADPEAEVEVEDLDGLNRTLALGVHTALDCARGLSALSRNRPIRLDVVTAGGFSVLGDELIRPEATAMRGPVAVIPLEYTGLTTRLIDVADGIADEAQRAEVVAELAGGGGEQPDQVIARRRGRRWAPTVALRPSTVALRPSTGALRPSTGAQPLTNEVDPAGVEPRVQPALRPQGRYLIVGGLGGVGLSIAHHLATSYQASLVLTSRRGRPVVDENTDPETRRRMALLDEIEGRATGLEVVAVDAGDEVAMTAMIERVEAEGGPLNGVIVAAGVADQMGAIHRRSRADMDASVASKIHGSLVLERALGERELDFVLLSSSIASVLYHNRFAQVGYVTGNSFAEAFALRGQQRGRAVVTVAWDDWLDIGMSVRAAQDFSAEFGSAVDLVDELHSFSPDEGVELFERALSLDEPVVVVSTTDLEARMAADIDVISPFLAQASAGDDDDIEVGADATTEDLVAGVWRTLLGFESFSPSDDFFELGGDSLQAARMADRLSRSLGIEVAVDMIFDAPVLADLAATLESMVALGSDGDQSEAAPGEGSSASEASASVSHEGPVVLSPGQARFLERGSDTPNHFNTSVLLTPRTPTTTAELEAAVSALVDRHEALRLRLLPPADGAPGHQVVVTADEQPNPLSVVDLSNLDEAKAVEALSDTATEVQHRMDLNNGPIFAVVLFLLPGGQQRILVVAHHLMSDRVSLLLLIDALEAALSEPAAGGSAATVTKATSVLSWVEALRRAGSDEQATAYVERLRAQPWERVRALPTDRAADLGANRNETVGVVVTAVAGTDMVARGSMSGARPDELILLGLAKALAAWSETDVALVELLGHGRRLPVSVDVSRSVGMFLTYSPVLVDFGQEQGPERLLVLLREAIADGWRFDPVRYYGASDLAATLRALPRSSVLFNYVGRAIATDATAGLATATEDRGPESDPGGRRDHALAVKAEMVNDETFELSFVYSKAIHDEATIERLAKATTEALIGLAAEH